MSDTVGKWEVNKDISKVGMFCPEKPMSRFGDHLKSWKK